MTKLHPLFLVAAVAATTLAAPAAFAMSDTAEAVDKTAFADRDPLQDPTENACDAERSFVQIKDNLWRHTNGSFPATHSGLVLITDEGALVIDAGNTCVARRLKDVALHL